MLVIERKRSERFFIGGNIIVTVVAISKRKIRLGIDAPKEVSIKREDIKNAFPKLGISPERRGSMD